jgi:hypothetical protein
MAQTNAWFSQNADASLPHSRASVSSETWGSNIAIKRRTNGDGRDMRSSN